MKFLISVNLAVYIPPHRRCREAVSHPLVGAPTPFVRSNWYSE